MPFLCATVHSLFIKEMTAEMCTQLSLYQYHLCIAAADVCDHFLSGPSCFGG